MSKNLTDIERDVLKTFVELDAGDPEGQWNWFYADILRAVEAHGGDATVADLTCRGLRKAKLLKGDGQGRMAAYYPTDKGREAVKEAEAA